MRSFSRFYVPCLGCWGYLFAEGKSTFDTLHDRDLPLRLGNSDNELQAIWNDAAKTGRIPDTNSVRTFDWTLSRSLGAPDGVDRMLMLINGQYPGPVVEANWGDTIQVTVHNNISGPGEGTSIHWHGQPQTLSPWMDGVPSVTQCPIAPGSSFVYEFRAEVYGTSWYHSHYSGQRIDGLFGPMVVHGPQSVDYDVDVGPVLLTDYMHTTYFEDVTEALEIPPTFLSLDNNLINGKNPFNCSLNTQPNACRYESDRTQFRFTSGKTHRLRLINAGGTDNQKFSIDGHEMIVFANDYVEVVPYTTKVVTLGVGQRTDVLVVANGKPTDKYWMRSDLDTGELCGNTTFVQSEALAAIYYEEADMNTEPSSEATPWSSNNCMNDPLSQTIPRVVKTPPSSPAVEQNFAITAAVNGSGTLLLFVNNSTFRADYNNPLLLLAHDGNNSYKENPQNNVYDFQQNKSIRAIFKNYFRPHPMHLHGHDFWVLAEGVGEWNGDIVNPENPQRRDTQILAPGYPDLPSYLVIEWMMDNPGVWALHCHVMLHVSVGLYVNVVEQPEDLTQAEIPQVLAQTCQDWAIWSSKNVVDEIDSGLKAR